jgi:hypothetical protein
MMANFGRIKESLTKTDGVLLLKGVRVNRGGRFLAISSKRNLWPNRQGVTLSDKQDEQLKAGPQAPNIVAKTGTGQNAAEFLGHERVR